MRGLLLVVGVVGGGCGRIAFEARTDAGGAAGDAAADGAPLDDAAAIAPNRAFVTSTSFDANLGGLAGADLRCQEKAGAADLQGTFVALLRTAAEPAFERLAGSRGWVDLTGRPIVDQPADWVGGLLYPLRVDETGAVIAGSQPVFRGRAGGNNTCLDWTSTNVVSAYERVQTDEAMTSESFTNCSLPARLACVERRVDLPVAPPQESGRLAFLTQGTWISNTGLASADALCQAEATGAILPGSYLAVLHSSGGPASARFDLGGAPWRRVDGPRLAPTAAGVFAQGGTLDTFVIRTATGAVPTTNDIALRAARGTSTAHCTDWTASSASFQLARPSSVLAFAFQGEDTTTTGVCGNLYRLVCFQE